MELIDLSMVSLGVGPDDTNLSRIRWDTANNRLIFNDNDNPGPALALNTYFGAGGDGNDLTFYVTDLDGTHTFNIADNFFSSGGNFLQFSSLPAALVTIFDNIVVSDRLIFSAARVAVTIHEVAVSTTRTGGTVSAAVTKTEPSANPVSVSLTRTGGSVTAAVTKDTPAVRPVAVSLTRSGGTVTAAVTKTEGLKLSEWDNTGLDVEFSALIEVSGTVDLYRDSDRGGSDTPIDGELGVGPNDTNVSRIRWDTVNNRLIFNDNDSALALWIWVRSLMLVVWEIAGRFTLPIFLGHTVFPVAGNIEFAAINAVRFQNLPATLVTILDNISVGDRFIISAARPEAVSKAGCRYDNPNRWNRNSGGY